MSKVILIEPDQELKRLLSINLRYHTGAEIITRDSIKDVIELIRILPSIDLIITPPAIEEDQILESLVDYFKNRKLDIPILSTGITHLQEESIFQLSSPIKWENIVRNSSLILGVDPIKKQDFSPENYVPISVDYIEDLLISPCDLYIRIKKFRKEEKYIKFSHAGYQIDKEQIETYKKQGLKNIFILRDYKQYFVSFVNKSLLERINTKNLPYEERHKSSSNAQLFLKDYLTQVGLTTEVKELTLQAIDSTLSLIEDEKEKEIVQTFDFLLNNKIGYHYTKNHLVTLLGVSLIESINGESDKLSNIFAQLSFFSDIYLKNQSQIQINSIEDLNLAEQTPQERENILEHAAKAADLISNFKELEPEVLNLIRTHQGASDGHGFPSEMPTSLPPILKVFMISDAFVKLWLDPKYPKELPKLVEILSIRFDKDCYSNILKSLSSMILK